MSDIVHPPSPSAVGHARPQQSSPLINVYFRARPAATHPTRMGRRTHGMAYGVEQAEPQAVAGGPARHTSPIQTPLQRPHSVALSIAADREFESGSLHRRVRSHRCLRWPQVKRLGVLAGLPDGAAASFYGTRLVSEAEEIPPITSVPTSIVRLAIPPFAHGVSPVQRCITPQSCCFRPSTAAYWQPDNAE